ncbi:MAG TPA: MTH1187 family thiamine-binding protein [Candidatus Eisenbacteria bacterium]|jgi:uncharacterized protein (TIGR00106 family)|nr:MTH1187 family thiamine-binding protein [Candidatus Eisenbacteria bacterium]
MLAILSVFPMGKGSSLSKYVAEAVEEIEKSGLDYRLTAMGTVIEGEWEPVMKLLKKIRDRLLKVSDRVYMTVAIDEKKDRRRRIEEKVKSVEAALGRSLKK